MAIPRIFLEAIQVVTGILIRCFSGETIPKSSADYIVLNDKTDFPKFHKTPNMKTTQSKLFLFLFCCAANLVVHAQQEYTYSEIKVIEQYQKVFNNLRSGDDSGLEISLLSIHITDSATDSVSHVAGVSIRVASEQVSQTMSSAGVALTGDLGVAFGRSKTAVVETNKGEIFLQLEDIETLVSFLEKSVELIYGGDKPEHNSSWRIDFEDGLTWGVLYDKKSYDRWFYFVEIGNARFEINYEEGLAMLKVVAKARRWINENR